MDLQYFGNLGNSETLTFSFTPDVSGGTGTRSNSWTMEVRDSAIVDDPGTAADESLIGSYTLAFNDSQSWWRDAGQRHCSDRRRP
jgi:flagellar hook protein FlgE